MKITSQATPPVKEYEAGQSAGFLYANEFYIVLCTKNQSREDIRDQAFTGVVVHRFNKDSTLSIGDTSQSWNSRAFKPFQGTVTLNQDL